MGRRLFKRETLIRNLEKVLESIPSLDLPADIVAVYAFGGMLRGKRRLHDFDLVFLYSMSEKQEERWLRFCRNFSSFYPPDRYPLDEVWSVLEPYWKRGIPLRRAVEDEALAKILSERGIVPQWAGCFSWTEILEGHRGSGLFYPSIEKVIKRMLLRCGVRGLQILVEKYETFTKGEATLAPKNYVLAWSPEKPDVRANLEMPQDEKAAFIRRELELFIEKISAFRESWMEAKRRVEELSVKAGVNLDLEALEKQHSKVEISGGESYEELRRKAETAREEMRRYVKETAILQRIARALENWIESKGNLPDHPAEDYISLWTIKGVKRREAKEEEVRKVLRTLKLPENHIITIKAYGRTWHEIARSEDERKRLLREAEIEKKRRNLILGVMRAVKPLDRDVKVYLEMDGEGRPRVLEMVVCKLLEEGEDIVKALERGGFQVRKMKDLVYGYKEIDLRGDEDLRALQTIAKETIRRCV